MDDNVGAMLIRKDAALELLNAFADVVTANDRLARAKVAAESAGLDEEDVERARRVIERASR